MPKSKVPPTPPEWQRSARKALEQAERVVKAPIKTGKPSRIGEANGLGDNGIEYS